MQRATRTQCVVIDAPRVDYPDGARRQSVVDNIGARCGYRRAHSHVSPCPPVCELAGPHAARIFQRCPPATRRISKRGDVYLRCLLTHMQLEHRSARRNLACGRKCGSYRGSGVSEAFTDRPEHESVRVARPAAAHGRCDSQARFGTPPRSRTLIHAETPFRNL